MYRTDCVRDRKLFILLVGKLIAAACDKDCV